MSLPVALLLMQLVLQLLLVGLALRWAWQQDRRDPRLVERLVTANDVEPPSEAK